MPRSTLVTSHWPLIGFLLSFCFALSASQDGGPSPILTPPYEPSSKAASHPIEPSGKEASHPNSANASNGIAYHGGEVMTKGLNIYYVWYGTWAGDQAVPIVEDLARNIGTTFYWAINSTYSDSFGATVAPQVRLASSIPDSYSEGSTLQEAPFSLTPVLPPGAGSDRRFC